MARRHTDCLTLICTTGDGSTLRVDDTHLDVDRGPCLEIEITAPGTLMMGVVLTEAQVRRLRGRINKFLKEQCR